MPFKLDHLVKLVPALISGTYVTYPTFLPTMPKGIKELLTERKCYIVATSKKEGQNKPKYLFACSTDPIGKTLDFFFFDSSRKIAVPVKHLKISSPAGGAKRGNKLT